MPKRHCIGLVPVLCLLLLQACRSTAKVAPATQFAEPTEATEYRATADPSHQFQKLREGSFTLAFSPLPVDPQGAYDFDQGKFSSDTSENSDLLARLAGGTDQFLVIRPSAGARALFLRIDEDAAAGPSAWTPSECARLAADYYSGAEAVAHEGSLYCLLTDSGNLVQFALVGFQWSTERGLVTVHYVVWRPA